MRITVISVSNQLPDLLLALRPSEIDDLILSLQSLKLNPARSINVSVASKGQIPIASVEIYLDETDKGPRLAVSPVAKRRKLTSLRRSTAA